MSASIAAERRVRARPVRRRPLMRTPWLWAVPALAFLAAYYVAICAGAWYGFTDWSGQSAGAQFIGFGNFVEILRDPVAGGAVVHTIVLAIAFVIVVNVLGLALALGLHRALKTRNLLRAMFFAPVVMSSLAVSYVWRYIFDFSGPLNQFLKAIGLGALQQSWLGSPDWALASILMVLVWQFTGLSMVFYLAGLQTIPVELYEASAVDGAGSWAQFRRITLPLLAPSITISFTFMLVMGLRVFDQVIALTGGGPVDATQTLATQVYEQTWVYGRFGYGAALALFLSALMAVFALLQNVVLRVRERRMQ